MYMYITLVCMYVYYVCMYNYTICIYVCIMNLTNLTLVKLFMNITHSYSYSILYVYKILT